MDGGAGGGDLVAALVGVGVGGGLDLHGVAVSIDLAVSGDDDAVLDGQLALFRLEGALLNDLVHRLSGLLGGDDLPGDLLTVEVGNGGGVLQLTVDALGGDLLLALEELVGLDVLGLEGDLLVDVLGGGGPAVDVQLHAVVGHGIQGHVDGVALVQAQVDALQQLTDGLAVGVGDHLLAAVVDVDQLVAQNGDLRAHALVVHLHDVSAAQLDAGLGQNFGRLGGVGQDHATVIAVVNHIAGLGVGGQGDAGHQHHGDDHHDHQTHHGIVLAHSEFSEFAHFEFPPYNQ